VKGFIMRFILAFLCLLSPAVLAPAVAQDTVNIRREIPSVTGQTPQGTVEIARNPDVNATISSDWARTSRPCPPFCIQPMISAAGVTPIGELEVLDILQDPDAILVDSRTSKWFDGGTIPGPSASRLQRPQIA
jgi:hypothetical protein